VQDGNIIRLHILKILLLHQGLEENILFSQLIQVTPCSSRSPCSCSSLQYVHGGDSLTAGRHFGVILGFPG
jgi:hypothetical protein